MVTEDAKKSSGLLPAVSAGVGMAAIVTGIAGIAGAWWGLIAAGILLIVWATLAKVGD